jgi:hypothetical protein
MERRLFLCGAGMPRVVERAGLTGGRIKGWLLEGAATSLLAHSNPEGQWNTGEVTLAAGGDSPLIGRKWCAVTETTATAYHGLSAGGLGYTSSWNTAVGSYFSFCCLIEAGIREYVNAKVWTSHPNNQAAYVTIDTRTMVGAASGQIGTMVEYVDHKIERISSTSALVRVIGYNAHSSTVAIAATVTLGKAVNLANYEGDDSTPAVSLLGGSIVVGTAPDYSSPIPTAGAAATRTSDTAPYWTNDYPNAQRGHAQTRVLLPAHTPLADITILDITDGTDYLRIKAAATTGYLTFVSSDGGETSIATNICDGEIHVLDAEWTTGAMQCWLDGVASVADTTVTIPTGLTRIQLGVTGGVTGYTRVWPTPLPELPQVRGW